MSERSSIMSRIKHILRIVFLCFVIFISIAVGVSINSLLNTTSDKLVMTDKASGNTISVSTKNGAAASYEYADNGIKLTVKNGSNYDDVKITVTLSDVKYDTAYLEKVLGDSKEQEKEYLDSMRKGPWNSRVEYRLYKDGGEYNKDALYTINDGSTDYTSCLTSSTAASSDKTELTEIKKGGKKTIVLTLGSEESGALESGTYFFRADLSLVSRTESNAVKLSYNDSFKLIYNVIKEAVAENGFASFFSPSSWLMSWAAVCFIGGLFFLWKDIRNSFNFVGALADGAAVTEYIRNVYVDGKCVRSELVRSSGAPGFIMSVFIGFIVYIVSLLLMPIRLVILLISDIIHAIIGSEESFSLFGNLLGSVGTLMLLYAIIMLLCAEILLGVIFGIIGIILMIVARFLCNMSAEI